MAELYACRQCGLVYSGKQVECVECGAATAFDRVNV